MMRWQCVKNMSKFRHLVAPSCLIEKEALCVPKTLKSNEIKNHVQI